MRPHRTLRLALAAALVLAGCGSSARAGSPASAPRATDPRPTQTPAASPSTTPIAATTPEPCLSKVSGAGTVLQAQIVDVRVATHARYDRIVFEFDGRAGPAGVPEYDVALATRPIYRDPSGLPLTIAGDPVLGITLRGGTKASLEGRSTYAGSTAMAPAFPLLRELKESGDFEAVATWYAGLSGVACVKAMTLTAPARLVIDLSRP